MVVTGFKPELRNESKYSGVFKFLRNIETCFLFCL